MLTSKKTDFQTSIQHQTAGKWWNWYLNLVLLTPNIVLLSIYLRNMIFVCLMCVLAYLCSLNCGENVSCCTDVTRNIYFKTVTTEMDSVQIFVGCPQHSLALH